MKPLVPRENHTERQKVVRFLSWGCQKWSRVLTPLRLRTCKNNRWHYAQVSQENCKRRTTLVTFHSVSAMLVLSDQNKSSISFKELGRLDVDKRQQRWEFRSMLSKISSLVLSTVVFKQGSLKNAWTLSSCCRTNDRVLASCKGMGIRIRRIH